MIIIQFNYPQSFSDSPYLSHDADFDLYAQIFECKYTYKLR